MSIYPMRVTKEDADHRGGTKAYHLLKIETADGRMLMVNRFGKVGAWGQMQVEQFETVAEGQAAYRKKRDQKFGGEYTVKKTIYSQDAVDLPDLINKVGAYWPNLGKNNVEWLVPGADTKDIREPTSKRIFDEHGREILNPRLVADPVEIPPSVDELKTNPKWGLF